MSAVSAKNDLRVLAERASSGELVPMRDEAERIKRTALSPRSGAPREAAVLMLFGTSNGEDADPWDCDVLLVERAATLSDHPGQIGFPGGGWEAGDRSLIQTALREAVEETGLDSGGVQVLGALPATALAVSNFLVTPVVAWWQVPSAVRVVDPAESARVFRVPLRVLLDPLNRRTVVVKHGAAHFRSPGFLAGDILIWGFTGGLLSKLFDELGWSVPWQHENEILAP